MIKTTAITLAFSVTLVEEHPQPDLPHKNYFSITESYNAIPVYGNIQTNLLENRTTTSYIAAMLAT